ncbi:MAG: Unknown protein [uncultured Sulfurovum sp.]|uniref:Uncharacterized protein n=1 Tax=uncultured Sulfurovum sp. TaxID=269237 RepID=A0A6S6S3R4_9BACT|nr:MAG: Unknown protein [uncultured Sulfurovum sp.]
MYFINIKQLKEDIINDDFGEGKQFIYFFVFLVLNTIFFELGVLIPAEEATFLDYFDSIFLIISTLVGTYFMYKGNTSEKGKDFIGRYFAITWVVFIRLIIPLFITSFILLVAYSYIDVISDFYLDVLVSLIFSIYIVLGYFYSYKHIVDINKRMIIEQ